MARKEHEEMTTAAERRAAITAHLSQAGEPRPVAQIAEAVGLSPRSAGQVLATMAKNKLLKVRKDGTAKLYFLRPDVALETAENSDTTAEPARKKPGRKPKRQDDAKSIEFVIAGMSVALSKIDGRIRVEINES